MNATVVNDTFPLYNVLLFFCLGVSLQLNKGNFKDSVNFWFLTEKMIKIYEELVVTYFNKYLGTFMSSTSLVEIPSNGNQQPLQPLEKPNTLHDGLLIAIPAVISLVVFAIREFIQLEVKRKNEEYSCEIESQKLKEKEQAKRVEYLEKQNEMLLLEILDLRRIMQISGPLSASMYNPSVPHSQQPTAKSEW